MIDELTIYNLSVKYPCTVDLVREIENIARADAIDEVMEKYVEVVCEDCSKCGGHCRHDEVMNMLKQLKEQKDE